MAGVGSTALITGASSGIGAAFARELAARGWNLILVARRKDRLEQLAKDCGGETRAEALAADLTDDADVSAVEARISQVETLDLVINNAGFGSRGRFWEADTNGQNQMHQLHVLATMRLTRAALRAMVPRGRGGVINVSSVAGFAASPGSASYTSTKAWMNVFTESIAMELVAAGSRVRVQALCPGFTYTEFHDVMHMDRRLVPKGWWMPAETVVAASLRGLERGRIYVIPGVRYKLLAWLSVVVPRSVRHAATRLYARRIHRV